MEVSLKSITPNAEINIVEIARVSSSRTDKAEQPEGLINYLIKNKHWSPLEHSYLTMKIITSKSIGIQLLRHRSFVFQEFSQRYSVVENVEPIELRWQATQNRQSSTVPFATISRPDNKSFDYERIDSVPELVVDWLQRVNETLTNIMYLYEEGVSMGVAKECARMILPMAAETTIYMTGSIRSWIHFLEIRDDGHAQKEVQLIAKEIKKIFIEQLPIISKALGYDNKS